MRKIFKRFASLLTIFILTIMSIVPVHASENTSVVNVTDTLMVFDGWGDTVRYLNFDFDSWTDISGTTFNG